MEKYDKIKVGRPKHSYLACIDCERDFTKIKHKGGGRCGNCCAKHRKMIDPEFSKRKNERAYAYAYRKRVIGIT